MFFLRRVHDVTLRDKVRSCEIRRVPNVEPFSSELREQRYIGSAMCPECPYKSSAGHVQLAKPTEKRFRGHLRPSLSDYISDLAWSRLDVEPEEHSKIGVHHEIFYVLLGLQPPDPP